MMRAAGQPYTQKVSHGFPSGPVLCYFPRRPGLPKAFFRRK
jgi:hypothetical protein